MSDQQRLPTAPDALVAGRYRLVDRVATSGMAEVWRARDEVLARPVAVKVLHRHLAADPAVRDRFRHEAIAAARLQHPNIVAIFDTVSGGDTEAIVMEYVAGRTVRELTEADEPPPLARAVAIVAEVAAALDHAHRAGVVHRDVKPSNILLSDDGRVLVADLGIATALDASDRTRPDGELLGTARYLAPEQVSGDPIGPAADLYALGVVFYELVCGRPPFLADTDAATALLRIQRPPLRPRQVRPGVPRDVDDLVMALLAKDPAERPASAGELRSRLLALDLPGGGALAADPISTVDRRTPLPGPGPVTPPSGTSPSFRETERSYLVPALVIVLIAGGLGVAAVILGATDVGQELFRATREAVTGRDPRPVAGLVPAVFDPEGDRREHDDEAPLAVDGDPATAWTTEGYEQRRFGTKSGVGLLVQLPETRPLRQLRARSTTTGWAGQVFVVDGMPPADLGGWGPPVAAGEGLGNDATFDLDGRRGRAVLLWVTDLGDGPAPFRFELTEVQLTS